ncbi:IclR family transcriptional regulator [Sinanaerobacter chloroacetimidivorans]|uniref:IclR family transcriptional regulator n=1 Tax=Sinanaerobacter chloroacetimidivorans TaxID=2818044 RepID=A0A8J7VXS7_9FIRM|nr:IclR family transcriptional regulator [Sinanaerobacter chloroacetimidivorans]MBR0596719.1 IclR family transcriptional regulator [Sinanaerobacter chloroacetimidivorans]
MYGDLVKDKSNDVKSIRKAFLIMEELDMAGELSLGDLSERLSMDKATVHRLVTTMKNAGYINQNKENKKYSNSLKLLAMGNRVMEKTGLKHIARPYIEDLAEKSGETINLSVRVGSNVIYIDKIESNSTIKVGITVGTSVPGYCTGMGKAVLAFLPEDELKELMKPVSYEKFTRHTAENYEELQEKLQKVREDGYSMDDEEYVDGLISFGAPIFDYHGNPIGAISVSCPKYRFEESTHLTAYSRFVVETANKISKQLGYSKPKATI